MSLISMTDYETDKKLATVKQGKLLSGSRTLLRLHRALLFIIAFFQRLKLETNSEKLGKLTWEAYSETLAHHHIWMVRKAVGLAVYMLPTRAELLAKMDNYNEQQALLEIDELTVELQQVYDIVQSIYVAHNFTNLP